MINESIELAKDGDGTTLGMVKGTMDCNASSTWDAAPDGIIDWVLRKPGDEEW